MNCVSTSQQRQCPATSLLLPAISNGVDISRFHWKNGKRKYALAMGRICPEKGFHHALHAAKKARVELLLAGEIFPYESHQHYFHNEIAPLLDRHRRFLGPVRFSRKRTLLAHARCLLIPSTVAETSSLVAMEALASGTPVIAYPSGALPEIIEHGRNGFLVSSPSEMADAISAASKIDPEACRAAARTRFSASEMVRQYFDTYDRIIAKVSEEDSTEHQAPVRGGASWLFAW
jgi:glycosyltransferase involved in cell wall biosynthesis